MANSPRDVAFKVSVETLGTEGIKNLQQQLSELAKEGGAAAPEFKQLADEIQRLGEQSKITSAIGSLSSDIASIATAEEEAAKSATELRSRLSELSDTTNTFRTKEEEAKTALKEKQDALFKASQDLKTYKNNTDSASKSSDDYKASVKESTTELIDAQTKIRNLADSYNAAKQATKEAAATEKEHADELKFATSAAAKLKEQLDAKNQSLREAKSQLEALGTESKTVAESEAELLDSYTKLSEAIENTTQAQIKAKQEAANAAAAEKAAIEERIAAEKEYANKLDVINAQITNARKAEIAKIQAAEKQANDERIALERERVAAEKAIQDWLVAETKKANDDRIDAEKAYREAVAEEGKRYANKLDIINQQIANAQKAANQKAETEAKQLADARIAEENRVAEAAKQVSDALGTVGVRSAANIKAEIQRVKDSLETLKSTGTLTGVELDNAFTQGARQINVLERELRGVNNELTISDRLANVFHSSMGQFAAGNIIANGVMLAAEKVAELGRAFITTMIQGEQLSKGMNAIYGDSKLAASQIDFLRKASVETGVSFSEVATEFVKFSASMKSANIPLEQSNALFKAVTAASSALGLGTEATAGALNALGQMASKGVVSMEELRQQLGDRLPGVMGLTAKAMGITEAELVKLVESGSLATRDFIVPFTKGMESLKGETDGVVPTFNKFKSALAGIAQDVGAAGGVTVMKSAVEVLGQTLTGVAVILSAFSEALFGVGKAAGVLVGALFTLTNPMEALKGILQDSSERFSKQQEVLKILSDGYDKAAEAAKANGAAIVATVEETRKAEQVVKDHANAQNLSKVAYDLVSNATLTATGNLTKFLVEVDSAIGKQEQQSKGSKLHVEAMKEQGKELIILANLTNDNTKVRDAEAKAAELEAGALEKLQSSLKAEVDLLVVKRTQILKDAEARHLSADATKTQIDAVDKKLVSAQAELEEIQKKTAAITAEAMARRLTSDALKDNSKNIDEYALSLTGAKANLDEIIEQEKAGILTKQDVKVAQEALARATYLYNDAVNDSVRAVELDTKAKMASLQISSAMASTGIGHYESLAKQARAINDTAMATYYDIEAKKQSIKVLELKMEMERLQNAAALAEIELKRKLIDSTTDEGQAKLKVLDIEAQLLQVKNINNEAIKDQIRNIDAEITALRNGNTEKKNSVSANNADSNARITNTGVIDNQTAALERQNAAIEREMAAKEKAAELERKRNNVDKEGFSTNKDGQRIVAVNELGSKTGIYNFLKSAGVDNEAVARKLASDFTGGADFTPYDVTRTQGYTAYGNSRNGESLSSALLKAAQDYSFGSQSRKSQMLLEAGVDPKKIPKFASGGYHKGGIRLVGENGPELEVTGPSQILNANQTKEVLQGGKAEQKQYTVNINLNGNTTSVNTATDSDATALLNVLQSLQKRAS